MDKERDYFYEILGLRPGASVSEVKAAYRKLTKFYHPDRDKSPDSEIMYREIRLAYEKLLNWDRSAKTSAGTVGSRDSSKHTTQASSGGRAYSKQTTGTYDNSGYSEEAKWTSEDWANWVQHVRDSNSKIPFELKNIHTIFWRSLNEMSFGNFIFPLMFAFLSCYSGMISPMKPYSGLAAWYYIISWFFLIIFRHYFFTSEWLFLISTVMGILYGSILIFLIKCFFTVPMINLFMTGVCATVSVWFLLSDSIYNNDNSTTSFFDTDD